DAHARVVAEDVHVAEDALSLVGRAREAFPIGDVELDGVHALAQAALVEALQGSLDVIGPEVRDNDLHLACAEPLALAEPDPARASGDERGLARNLLHTA